MSGGSIGVPRTDSRVNDWCTVSIWAPLEAEPLGFTKIQIPEKSGLSCAAVVPVIDKTRTHTATGIRMGRHSV
jgi:hypothetical protein